MDTKGCRMTANLFVDGGSRLLTKPGLEYDTERAPVAVCPSDDEQRVIALDDQPPGHGRPRRAHGRRLDRKRVKLATKGNETAVAQPATGRQRRRLRRVAVQMSPDPSVPLADEPL